MTEQQIMAVFQMLGRLEEKTDSVIEVLAQQGQEHQEFERRISNLEMTRAVLAGFVLLCAGAFGLAVTLFDLVSVIQRVLA